MLKGTVSFLLIVLALVVGLAMSLAMIIAIWPYLLGLAVVGLVIACAAFIQDDQTDSTDSAKKPPNK